MSLSRFSTEVQNDTMSQLREYLIDFDEAINWELLNKL